MKPFLRRLVRPLFLSLGICFVLGSASHAQTRTRESASNANQRAIERRVRAFYAFWGKPDDAMKNRALMRFYTSRRLNRWLYSSAYEDYDSDYFLQAQDYDDDWNQAHVRDARVSGNTARLLATLGSPKPANKGLGEQKLRLKMVKEDGLWKIDAVAPLNR